MPGATVPGISSRLYNRRHDRFAASFQVKDTIMASTFISAANAAWLYVVLAGLCEIGWAVALKYTEGFTRLWPSLFTILCMVVSMALIALALKTLPMGSVYAMWTGIGAVGTVLFGILIFGEPATLIRLSCIGLIIVGMVGLKFAS